MEFVEIDELVGKLIPRVHFNKITLENGGNEASARTNPHIQEPGSTRTTGLVEGTKITQPPPGGSFGPDQEPDSPDNLKVTLDLVAKDRIKNLQNSWFGDIGFTSKTTDTPKPFDLRDYINIHILKIDSSNADTTMRALIGQDDWQNTQQLSASQGAEVVSLKDAIAQSDTLIKSSWAAETISDGNQKVKVYDIPYKKTFTIEHWALRWDSAGRTILRDAGVTIPSEDALASYNPSHLSFYVWTEFDLQGIATDFDFDATTLSTSNVFQGIQVRSDVSYQNVIKNGSLVRQAHVFRRAGQGANGAIWTGDVHQMANGEYMTGKTHAANSFPLTKQNVRNGLIQDMRSVNRIQKLNLDFSSIQNILKTPRLETVKSSIMTYDEGSYFSDIHLTRDRNNNARFFFALKYDEMFINNSVYPSLFKNPATTQTCLQRSQLRSLKIYRSRIGGSPEIGSTPKNTSDGLYRSKSKKFNENFEIQGDYYLLVSSSEGGGIPNVNTTDGDELLFEARDIGNPNGELQVHAFDEQSSIREVGGLYNSNPIASQGVRYFTGTDQSVKYKTDGYYQYKVVVEVQDGAIDFLTDKFNTLLDTKLLCKEYYTEATKLGAPGFTTPYDDPHIVSSTPGNVRLESKEPKPGNFDIATNRFTPYFIEWVQDHFQNWKLIASNYAEILTELGAVQDPGYDVENLFELYISPYTGNPEGIMTVLKLIEDLENIIGKAIQVIKQPVVKSKTGEIQNQAASTGEPRETGSGRYPSKKTFKVEYTFDNYFNANLPVLQGLDIFGFKDSPSNPGFRNIESDTFAGLVQTEVLKVFESPNIVIPVFSTQNQDFEISDTIQRNDFSFFTPSSVDSMQKGTIDLTQTTANNIYNDFIAESTMSNTSGFVSGKPISDMTALFMGQNFNLIVVPDPEPTTPVLLPGETNPGFSTNFQTHWNNSQVQYRENSAKAFSAFSELMKDLPDPKDKYGNDVSPITKNDLILYDMDNPNGYFQRSNATRDEVRALPNQIKALFAYNGQNWAASNLSQGTSIFKQDVVKMFEDGAFSNPTLEARMRYSFETIYEMEAFTGWQMTSETFGSEAAAIKSSLTDGQNSWQRLTRELYNQASGKKLLCRLKAYENPTFGIKPTTESIFPLFENYFIINAGTVENLPTTYHYNPLAEPDTNRGPVVEVEVAITIPPVYQRTEPPSPTTAPPGSVGGSVNAATYTQPPEQTTRTDTSTDGPGGGTTSNTSTNRARGSGASFTPGGSY